MKHARQHALCPLDLLGFMLFHGLFKDTGQAVSLALLSLEVAPRPVMQQPTKPAFIHSEHMYFPQTSGMYGSECVFVRHPVLTGGLPQMTHVVAVRWACRSDCTKS